MYERLRTNVTAAGSFLGRFVSAAPRHSAERVRTLIPCRFKLFRVAMYTPPRNLFVRFANIVEEYIVEGGTKIALDRVCLNAEAKMLVSTQPWHQLTQ